MLEQVVTVSIGAFFALWFVLSIGFQVRPIASRLGRYDRLGLLPRWTFFAPNPGIYDHHIIFRECDPSVDPTVVQLEGGDALTPWRELDGLCTGNNVPLIWNPQRRVTKTITDVVNSMAVTRRLFKDKPNLIQFTLDYFLLLHLVQREARDGALCQFAIIRSHGFIGDRAPNVVFISNFHRVAS